MPKLRDWFSKAFTVETPADGEPNDAERQVADRVCREVVRRRLTTPALMFLEMSRPLNYVGAQTMHFFQPIVAAIFDTDGYQLFAGFLEKRASIEYLARRIEQLEAECETRESAPSSEANDSPGAA